MIIRLLILVFGLFAPIAHAQELVIAQTTAPRLEWSYQPAPGCAVVTPTIDVQSSETFVGTYTRVARLLISATTYTLPAVADNRYYRVATACGNSNIVQYVAATPPPTGPTLDQRMTTVETSLAALRLADQSLSAANVAQDTVIASVQAALTAVQSAMQALVSRVTLLETEPPPAPAAPTPTPTSNFTVTLIDVDHLSIFGNCASIRTSGSGTRRTLECVH